MRETIRINPPTRDNSAPLAKLGPHRAKASFQETLEGAQRVRFSRHASQRMATREIELDNDKLHELERAGSYGHYCNGCQTSRWGCVHTD